MNPMESGYFVRQRNEEVMREVQKNRIERRLRANTEASESLLHEGKRALRLRHAALIVVVMAVLVASSFSVRAFASHEQHYSLTPGIVLSGLYR